MKHLPCSILMVLALSQLGGTVDGPVSRASGAAQEPTDAGRQRLETLDDRQFSGTLVRSGNGEFSFQVTGASEILPERILKSWSQEGVPRGEPLASSPFRFLLTPSGSLSGRLIRFGDEEVVLETEADPSTLTVARAGIAAIEQTPGEFQVVNETFETIDVSRWSINGQPETSASLHQQGERSLRLPAGGSSVTTRLPELVSSGRLELAFYDDETERKGHRWFVDLTFRKPNSDLATIRVVMGWNEPTLAVESPGGPAMNIQPLLRKKGWHRLSIKFDDRNVLISVDGDELAHGSGVTGSAFEVRLATEVAPRTSDEAPSGAFIDDLRLVRFANPSRRVELDPTQDELRLITGDQLFGRAIRGTGDRVTFRVDEREQEFRWSDISGVYFRRVPAFSQPLEGKWAQVAWQAAENTEKADWDRVEGVIVDLNQQSITVEVPFLGRFTLPRERLRTMDFEPRARRLVIDPAHHHLGDRMVADLDPPQPEPGPLEIEFSLAEPLDSPVFLVMDVVQVIGEEGTPVFSEIVKKGELRTSLVLNDQPIGDLNHFITSRNDEPLRVRIPVNRGVMKAGRNHLQIRQTGTHDDPGLRDNLGLLGIALEIDPATAAKP